VLTAEFARAHPEILGSQPAVELPTLDASGSVRKTRLVRVPMLQLGNRTLHGVIATIAPPATGGAGARLAGVIGGGLLSRFDVLIDLPHAALTLTPNAYYDAPFEADMSGMLVLVSGSEGERGERSGEPVYTIAGISEKSPAADAGLRPGDRLVEVGGKRVTAMSLDLMRNVLKSGPGTRVVVTIDRSGKNVMVTLTLRRAI
jgi:membrane-associated protease RseP (regulator of RpoE activity)